MIGNHPVLPFSGIIGQERTIRLLQQTIQREKMPHAYLFVGAPGVGRTTMALAMAQALNCEAPERGEGCGRCRCCRQLLGGNFPDVELVEPEGQSIGIEQVRELERRFGYKPLAGKYRVTVIRPAEAMTEEASNAFLKTLEEPPPGNVLILNATDPSDLLATIVSRCRKVIFSRIPLPAIEQWLVENRGVPPERASVLARISGGSLGKALDMEENAFLEKRREYLLLLDHLQTLAPGEAVSRGFDFVRGIGKGDRFQELKTLLELWKTWYRDLLLLKATGSEVLLINIDFSHELKIASEAFKMDTLLSGLLALEKAEKDLLRFRNQELVLETTVLRLKKNDWTRTGWTACR